MTKRRTVKQREVRPPSRQERLEQQHERQAKQNRTISIIAGVLIVLVIVVVVWEFVIRPNEGGDEPGAVMEGERPLAALEPAERNDFYTAYPEIVIDAANNEYEAIIATNKGEIRVDLFDEEAPLTVNNFVFLANQGFYDGVIFHRVLPEFMAQGGDPTGSGTGGPGYSFEDETDNGLVFDRRGLLAMANSGPNTNGSQFFITFAPTTHLNGAHTIFGEVIEGDEVLSAITLIDPSGQQAPADATPDVIERIEIIEQ
jgi:cyclophilin family peptidyl-prolyl cis-trans isomerase